MEEYELYLEKISTIIHVTPKIGAILYIVEWYIIYVIVYLMSGSWVYDTNTFGIADAIPFFITLIVGWGILYLKKSYINTSKKMEFLLKKGIYHELSIKMMHKRVTIFTYVIFAIFGIVCAIISFFYPDGIPVKYGLAGQIFIVHNLIWYLVIAIPVLAECVSLIFGVMSFPHLISKGIRYDVINTIEPYRCGGLRPIGELCFSGGFIYFSGLTLYTVLFYNLSIMNILVIIMWVVGFLMFLLPQYQIHKLLRKRKKDMLGKITYQIYAESKMHDLIHGSITEKNAVSLYTLIILFSEVEKMHDYPFDLSLCTNFIFVSIIPFMTKLLLDSKLLIFN